VSRATAVGSALAAALLGGLIVAFAAWSASGAGPAGGGAMTMPQGSQPTAQAAGTSVTVTWTGSALQPNGPAVGGYVLQRYDASSATGPAITPAAGCAGVIAGTSCTETGVAAGSWQYTVTPVQKSWHGAESRRSAAVAVNTKLATATTLAGSPNPSVFGAGVTFTATVSAAAGTPTGTVSFSVDGSPVASAALNAAGQAGYTTGSLGAGSHTVSAAYGGDAGFAPSTSANLTQTVKQAATTTAVSSTPDPSTYGQSVAFTVTVSANAPGAGTPTGGITVSDGGTQIAAGSLTSGAYTFSSSALGAGSRTITAAYAGDANFSGGVSTSLVQQVSQAGTTTALASSTNPSAPGQPVTLTATVSSSAGVPTGSVTFMDGSAALGSVSLSGGKAALTTSTLANGTHDLTAVYGGDSNFGSSTSNHVSQAVSGTATTTTLSASTLSPGSGQPVTFTAQVSSSASPPVPTGTVTFSDGGAALGSAALDSTGKAALTTSTLADGVHVVTAAYGGDSTYPPSTSSPVTVTVGTGCTINWTGAVSNSWNQPGNWLDAQGVQRLPGGSDRVCVAQTNQTIVYSSGTTALLSLVSADPLALNGGELDLTDTGFASQLNGGFSQSPGSTLGGPAAVKVNGPTTIAGGVETGGSTSIGAGVGVNLTGTLTLGNGRRFENGGIVTQSAADVDVDPAATVAPQIDNLTGGTWRITSSAQQAFNPGSGLTPSFTNAGTFDVAAAGEIDMGWVFQNSGALSVDSGDLNLAAGDAGMNSGSYHVAAGATLNFSGSDYAFPSTDTGFSGPGTVSTTDGSLTLDCPIAVGGIDVSGGALKLDVNASVTSAGLEFGSLSGTGTLTVAGTGASMGWAGGILDLNTVIGVGATLNLAAGASLQMAGGITLSNAGTVNDSAGNLYTDANAETINNTGTWNSGAAGNVFLSSFSNPISVFNNSGTVSKTTADQFSVGWSFANTGSVSITGGKLNLNGGDGGTDSGSYAVASGTTFELGGGIFHFTGTAGVTGLGRGLFDASLTRATFDAPYGLSNLPVSAGTVTLNVGSAAGATLVSVTVSAGGTLNLNLNTSPSSVTLSNGSLSGLGTMTVTGVGASMNWSGGTLGLSTVIDTGSTLTTGTLNSISMVRGITLTNRGTVNDLAPNLFTDVNTETINNSGTWNAGGSSDVKLSSFSLTRSSFNNTGTINKNGAGRFTVSFNLVTSGTVNVTQGILQLTGTYAPVASAISSFTIAGATAGSGYGQLQANFYALDGSLAVGNGSGFNPASGSTYQLLVCSGSSTCGSGQFSTVTVPSAYVTPPTYNATNVTLGAA
jgi:hypothetical protein